LTHGEYKKIIETNPFCLLKEYNNHQIKC
jgi:hypothetical protein